MTGTLSGFQINKKDVGSKYDCTRSREPDEKNDFKLYRSFTDKYELYAVSK